jgi:hypothetical protein
VHAGEEQAVIIYLQYTSKDDTTRFQALEDKLASAVEKARIGEFDGNEIGQGIWTIYLYGPNAEQLSKLALPILNNFHPHSGSYIVKRFGKPGSRQEKVFIGSGK